MSSKLSFTKQPQLSKVVKPFNDYLTRKRQGIHTPCRSRLTNPRVQHPSLDRTTTDPKPSSVPSPWTSANPRTLCSTKPFQFKCLLTNQPLLLTPSPSSTPTTPSSCTTLPPQPPQHNIMLRPGNTYQTIPHLLRLHPKRHHHRMRLILSIPAVNLTIASPRFTIAHPSIGTTNTWSLNPGSCSYNPPSRSIRIVRLPKLVYSLSALCRSSAGYGRAQMKRAWQPGGWPSRRMGEKLCRRRPREVEREPKTVLRMKWLARM